MELAAAIIGFLTLCVTLVLRIMERSPETKESKFVLTFTKERRVKRHKDIKNKDSKELSKDLHNKKDNIKSLLKDGK